MENPDRFNNIYLSLPDLRWNRDETLPSGQVLFTAVTDGRMIGCSKLLLSDDLARIESLYVQPRTDTRNNAAGEFIGQWLVDDGCYLGSAGARNSILFWVQDGVIVGIVGGSSEDWDRTYSHMRQRHEDGDRSIIPTDDERTQIQEEQKRAKHLPRLRIPGDPPRAPLRPDAPARLPQLDWLARSARPLIDVILECAHGRRRPRSDASSLG